MAQTVQILRTTTNNPPPTLLPGALSVELGTQTKLWVGSAGGNRLLMSSDPADIALSSGCVVAATPPANPIPGLLWWDSTGGQLYVRFQDVNSTAWIAASSATGSFLPLSGGTMTGPLILSGAPTDPNGAVTKAYSDLKLPLTGGALTGALTIQPGSGDAQLSLRKAASGQYNLLYGYTGATTRWGLFLGDNAAESGANAGSNFDIARYADNGAFIDIPLSINRATGLVATSKPISVGSTFATTLTDMSNDQLVAGHLHGADLAYNAYFSTAINNWKWASNSVATILGLTGGNLAFYSTPTGTAGAQATLNRRFMVDPNGATYFDAMGGNVLSITTPINTDAGISLKNGNREWVIHNQGYSSPGQFWIYDITASGLRLVIDTNGQCFNTSGTWTSLSDVSLKESITPYTRGLDAILALNPVSFVYSAGTPFAEKEPSAPRIGLIAQEVQPYIPEVVGEAMFTIAERETPLSTLNGGDLVYVLINGMKEIDARLKAGGL